MYIYIYTDAPYRRIPSFELYHIAEIMHSHICVYVYIFIYLSIYLSIYVDKDVAYRQTPS